MTLVFDAILLAEMTAVDSNDPHTSPDSQRLLGIGYAPLSSGHVQAWFCDGIDIVQSDHAPEAGVAQEIFHGDLIRHQGRHQEELEEELEEEVERRVKREHSRHQTQVRMHG